MSSLEEKAITKQEGYDDPSGLDKAKAAPLKGIQDPFEDPAIRHQYDKVCAELDANSKAYDIFMDQIEAHDEAVRQAQVNMANNVSSVPLEQTLGYRIYDRIRRDGLEAQVKYQEARDAHTNPMDRGDFDQDKSVEDFDESRPYRAAIALYLQKPGGLNKEERENFEAERDLMIGRVIREMDVIFTTCNNSGIPVMVNNFSFDVNCMDEVGQVTMASFCVPLTAFKGYKGVLIFGDSRQLKPTVLSTGLNEFVRNARVSPLALLVGANRVPERETQHAIPIRSGNHKVLSVAILRAGGADRLCFHSSRQRYEAYRAVTFDGEVWCQEG